MLLSVLNATWNSCSSKQWNDDTTRSDAALVPWLASCTFRYCSVRECPLPVCPFPFLVYRANVSLSALETTLVATKPPEGHLRGAGPPTSCDDDVGVTASLTRMGLYSVPETTLTAVQIRTWSHTRSGYIHILSGGPMQRRPRRMETSDRNRHHRKTATTARYV